MSLVATFAGRMYGIRSAEAKRRLLDEARQGLEKKLAGLRVEHMAVCRQMRNLDSALAWSAARWAIDQAVALGAQVVFIEGLGSLEAGGLGHRQNARVSATVRTKLFEAMRHLGAKAGIAVIEVPARGTSADCPRCLRKLCHQKAPDNYLSGHRWARCPHCRLSLDRDVAAAWRIASRGLASRRQVLRRKDGHLQVRPDHHNDVRVARALRRSYGKRRPTPSKPQPVPMRRRPPFAAPIVGARQKRPEGRVPQVDRQVPIMLTQQRRRHEPCGEPLGRGFHRNVYASPVRPYGNWGPGVETTPTLSFA